VWTLHPVRPVGPMRPVDPMHPVHPVGPVGPLVWRHMWLRLVRPETLVYTRLRLDTCNSATLPPMHPDLDFNTIAPQD